ncbi:type II secretion system F family protein [Tessaracoccus lacteus]|uniref:Type II secretion system F family protein n=1 Tax=Tessaracoccus lacteus TaxID=3041766 RepID=A0ABY8PY48_9ACTN|nr:type II secretion system F family protein [Tessaracoccus sp. T21]WGT47399.1 type II secretion system F family protein [Tessaracoccus sp. T21]
MGVSVAAAAGAALCLGIVLIVAGLRRRERELSTGPSTGLWVTGLERWRTMSRGRQAWIVAALALGPLAAAVSGWPLAAVLLPAVLIVVPGLLTQPAQPEIDVLAGLDRWVRLVSTSLTSGKSVRDAIVATRAQAPDVLKEPVARLVARLDQRWTMRDALFAMADELNLADADAVLAALSVAAARGGGGARVTLGALTDSLQDRLRALREVAAERAKPRAVVRQVTVITLVVLAMAVFMSPQFFAPYTTPMGSLLAAALAATYLCCLVMLRRKTVPPPAPRFLRSQP